MSDDVTDIKLPARLGLDQAEALTKTLTEASGSTTRIDASEVSLLGGSCLQVILAAARSKQETSGKIEIIDASTTFQESIAILGVDMSSFPAMEVHQ